GWTEAAAEAARRAGAHPPQTAWDHWASGVALLRCSPLPPLPPVSGWEAAPLGLSLLNALNLAQAAAAFEKAVALEPHGLWPNFYHALCCFRLGRHDDAVRSLSVCIGASPDRGRLFYNRALAQAALGRAEEARRDWEHARRCPDAESFPVAAVHFNLAVAHLRRGDRQAAAASLQC